MANEALITVVENLRDAYGRRQRAANSLAGALKGATGALAKAGRTLAEYADQDNGVDGDKLAQARDAFTTLRLRDEAIDPLLPELRREVAALTATGTLLKEALAALRGEVVDVVQLARAYKGLQTSKVQDDALTALLPGLDRELQQAQLALGATFGEALRAALATHGVEASGRPPRYEIGRFEIAADFGNRSAAITYGKDVVVPRVALSVDAVVKAYQRAAKEVMGRNEDGVRWMDGLNTAWETARQRRSGADGRANIVDCYYYLALQRQSRGFHTEPRKSRYVDYGRAQFAYDFYEFVMRQRRTHDGLRVVAHIAAKSQAESPDRSIWIVHGNAPHDGHYYGDIAFIKE